MTAHPRLKAFNFAKWIEENDDRLKLPVNK
jgi:hypothetical protein